MVAVVAVGVVVAGQRLTQWKGALLPRLPVVVALVPVLVVEALVVPAAEEVRVVEVVVRM